MSIVNAGELVVMAERETRERCAEIARSFPKLLPLSKLHVRQVTGEDIAKAIEADELYATPRE
jgi:hypothetical protein